jgi:AcrR family transcriptional regulator
VLRSNTGDSGTKYNCRSDRPGGNTVTQSQPAIHEAEQQSGIPQATAQPSGEFTRRRQLLEIAYNLIATRGFEGLRFREVAARAGINNATLCYHFPSKEALIQAVTEHLMERLRTPQGGSEQGSPANALEELRQMFAGTRRRLKEDSSFFVVITELALRAKRDPAINSIGEQRDSFWAQRVTGILERGVAQGVFRRDLDVVSTALALMTQIKGIAHHAAMRERQPEEIDAIVSMVAAQVEHWLICPELQSTDSRKSAHRPTKAASVKPMSSTSSRRSRVRD